MSNNKKLKILNDFPSKEELNTLFKCVGFPRANQSEYESYKKETCYSVQVRDESDLIGMAYVTNPTLSGEPYMIYAVAVDPDYQRQGIGSLMMNNIIDWYKSMPSDKPLLSLYCDIRLTEFYTKFGFINESLHQMIFHEWASELNL